ncbi:MAG TPA: ABC transporter permease [Gemmatimonadaceae bacterium]|nr:ABC transporter permease [Gemmatimonadaceae bacterium]
MTIATRIPRLVHHLLARAVPPAMRDEIIGDLEEEARERQERHRVGRGRLALWCWVQALRIAARFAPGRRAWRRERPRARPAGVMSLFLRDLQFGARGMLRRPGFTLVTTLTLALGIGVTTAIFSVIHAVLLNPLPYPDADRVGLLWQRNLSRGAERDLVAPGNFLDWHREGRDIFAHLAAVSPWGLEYVEEGEPESVPSLLVSRGFFEALGARPHLGRLLVADDFGGTDENARGGGAQVLVFTHEYWRRRFGGDSTLIGRTVRFSNTTFTVVGVLEPGFESPVYPGRDIFAPLKWWPGADENRQSAYLGAVARLRDGVTLDAARRSLDLVGSRLAAAHPRDNTGLEIAWVPVREQVVGRVQRPLLVLLGAVATILLIACANIANLLLARATERRGEFALRVALGAERGRLVRQLLTESLLLATVGSVAGLVLAHWTARFVLALAPRSIPRLDETALNLPVAAFAFGITLLTAVLIGLVPAWSATRSTVSGTLRESAPATSGSASQHRLRGVFTMAQVALAMVLLLSAGLLMRSFQQLLNRELGFRPERLLAMQMYVWVRYPTPEGRIAYFEQVLDAVRQVPGVNAASIAQTPPFHPDYPPARVAREGESMSEARHTAWGTIAAPGYFGVVGIPLLAGREFAAADGPGATNVAVINHAMARRLWGEESAIGKRFVASVTPAPVTLEVVGVVGDFRQQGLDDEPRPMYFQPHAQNPSGAMVIVVRTAAEPTSLLESVKRAVWSINPTQPFYAIGTLEELMSRSVSQRRFAMVLLTIFAMLAGVLATIGTYGVVSYIATQRRQEIGIRIAMGARPGQVLWAVSKQGLVWIAAGVMIGLALTLMTSRLLRALLYEISPTDPLTLAGTSLLLLGVAAAASCVAALRASRIDPVTALRGY